MLFPYVGIIQIRLRVKIHNLLSACLPQAPLFKSEDISLFEYNHLHLDYTVFSGIFKSVSKPGRCQVVVEFLVDRSKEEFIRSLLSESSISIIIRFTFPHYLFVAEQFLKNSLADFVQYLNYLFLYQFLMFLLLQYCLIHQVSQIYLMLYQL